MKSLPAIMHSLLATLVAAAALPLSLSASTVDKLSIPVTPQDNREYSFTDKKASNWYGRTHQDNFSEWFAGWNVDRHRIFSDYTLAVDGKTLSRKEAEVTFAPDCLTRRWSAATEKFQMVDHLEILSISLSDVKGRNVSITLNEGLLQNARSKSGALCFTPKENTSAVLKVVPMREQAVSVEGNTMTVPAAAGGFIIVCGSEARADELIATFRSQGQTLLAARRARMNGLIDDNNPLRTNLPSLDNSLAWIALTMDELVTNHNRKGIYAGLPWFNEYWGRDQFISMPGATFVTGKFEYAKEIIADFAKLQDTDPQSATYGRIPNVVNERGAFYNTADGTPRFVMCVEELVRYSGDRSFLAEMYPAVKLSIDATIAKFTDRKGYVTHAAAETWMDVMRGTPGSPRDNRANDIQYLWHSQLTAGARMAALTGHDADAQTWNAMAERVAANFEKDFCNPSETIIYDHLNADGSPDRQFRPNQLFCYDLVGDDAFKQQLTRRIWEELVYPWGVASLAQWDPQFHPQHKNPDYYHKDDAYHNGTVWLWLNGIAMQRMIEYGQTEQAWQLFTNMNRQALHEGAVGSLSENADAHPRQGKTWADRSGTFLQAWSNAEHLRVWHQYFLGIRPDLINGVVTVEPKLPAAITDIDTEVRIGSGKLIYKYHNGQFDITLSGIDARLDIILPTQTSAHPIFDGVKFCQPDTARTFPCMQMVWQMVGDYNGWSPASGKFAENNGKLQLRVDDLYGKFKIVKYNASRELNWDFSWGSNGSNIKADIAYLPKFEGADIQCGSGIHFKDVVVILTPGSDNRLSVLISTNSETAIAHIAGDASLQHKEFYTLQGCATAGPIHGVYIEKQGGKSRKIAQR